MTGQTRSVVQLAAAGLALVLLVEAAVFLVDRRWVLPAAGLAAGLLALEMAGRLGGDRAGAPGPTTDPGEESLRRWQAQTELMISWADATRADWDRHLRPKLARDFMLATRQKDPAALGPGGRAVFGELWEWVDPHGARPGGRTEPGPGRAVLEEILLRMDQI